ncbi:MAG: hypothetical protein ACU0BF_02095 [Paracoccaceae bacterium]
MRRTFPLIATTSTVALMAHAGLADTAPATPEAWSLLAEVEIDERVTPDSYEVRKSFPAALEGGIEGFAITGYAVPLSLEGAQSQLIVVSDMAFCPFCGSPEHGTSLMVEMAEPAIVEEGMRIRLVGDLSAVTDPETWQSAILTGARVVPL